METLFQGALIVVALIAGLLVIGAIGAWFAEYGEDLWLSIVGIGIIAGGIYSIYHGISKTSSGWVAFGIIVAFIGSFFFYAIYKDTEKRLTFLALIVVGVGFLAVYHYFWGLNSLFSPIIEFIRR